MTAPTSGRVAGWFATVNDAGPPVQVVLDGDDTPVPAARNSNYSPTAADRVYVVQLGRQMLIVCKVTP